MLHSPNIVEASNLTVTYQLSEYKTSTLKEWVFNRLKGRSGARSFRAVDGVGLTMQRGETVALIGHNGSGKSTLLRVIAGIIPTKNGGSLNVTGRIAPLIELGAGFDGELSGRENIYLSCLLMGLSLDEIEARIEAIIEFSELREFIHVPVKNYSSGMYARLGFACATSVDPDLLIVDEVLAVGDSNFSAKCHRRIEELKRLGVSVLIVSHDEATVRRFCDRAIVMNKGKAVFDGDVNEAYRLQREIMLGRMDESITPEKRKREEKHIEIAERAAMLARSSQAKPVIEASCSFWQDNRQSQVLDFSKDFSVKFAVKIKDPEHFAGDTYFGIELRHSFGCRVGGVGSEPRVLMEESAIRRQTSLDVVFRFPNGIPDLLGNSYSLAFAINDMAMARNVYFHDFGLFEFTNSAAGMNEHSDIMGFSKYDPEISVREGSR